MSWQTYIERTPGVMLGKPVFRNSRMTVEFVLERLAQGSSESDLLKNYPALTHEHVLAAMAYAAAMIRNDEQVLQA